MLDSYPWVVPMSSTMTLSRFDHSGIAGLRWWHWSIQNELNSRHSYIDYLFYQGENVLKVTGWIDSVDPSSEQFQQVADHLDELVQKMEFIGREAAPTKEVKVDEQIYIDQEVFNENMTY